MKKKNYSHVYHLYTVYHPKRDLILKELKKKNIKIKIYYPFPIHKMKAYAKLKNKKQIKLEKTEKMSKGIFSLPLYPELKYKKAYKFAKILRKIITKI